jgi:hypothetical protein
VNSDGLVSVVISELKLDGAALSCVAAASLKIEDYRHYVRSVVIPESSRSGGICDVTVDSNIPQRCRLLVLGGQGHSLSCFVVGPGLVVCPIISVEIPVSNVLHPSNNRHKILLGVRVIHRKR